MPAASTILSIVVPCFNEQDVLCETCSRLLAVRAALVAKAKISPRSHIVFVDDGSRDSTWQLIEAWVQGGSPVTGVKLSRNCGHQNALLAGMSCSRADAVVTIDADLQDDETAIERMVDAYLQGCEVVYGVRARRDSDSWFKRVTARGFYRLLSALGVPTVFDHADYRLLGRRAIDYLQRFGEINLFLRGVVPLLGLRSCAVHYDRRPRRAGVSKYPLRRMIEFALDGITSFSIAPLRAITVVGMGLSLACVGLAGWALAVRLTLAEAVPGWASTILPIFFLGGVQLFCVGMLGEYIGKIYMESKKRPRYLIETVAKPEGLQRRAGAAKRKSRPHGARPIRIDHRRWLPETVADTLAGPK
ncbi:glycosyltransferase family 2 protein [Ramlibacter algicola]|uniref:Glycosyltransferase family 2 protein n=1 Tax=Ramlibacter algicola TaxID=2795217 RepID=A0A934Q2N6_9BURK|nr:glycosyltransferase family 2 protein [Ramlibacter algicola]MBK0394018.1 glycosyltransferase family 2 protein [Ramlibacter algicola]